MTDSGALAGFSFNLLMLLLLVHLCMPKARHHTSKFFSLGYLNPDTGLYGMGRDDGYLILFGVTALTGLRAGVMEYVLAPFARTQGILKKKAIARFSEQAWMFIYYSVFWPLGMVSGAGDFLVLPCHPRCLGAWPLWFREDGR